MKTENRVAEIFVELADTLVADFDSVDFMHTLVDRTVELLRVDAAGVILADPRGHMQVVASTSNKAEDLELFAIQNDEGPCLDCINLGVSVANLGGDAARERWPRFSQACSAAGYQSSHAVPLRLRSNIIGALNLFCADRPTLGDEELALAQALADIATIGLLQERAAQESHLISEQLQTALNSRIIIEQAKGVVMGSNDVDAAEAFRLLRDYSRRNNAPLRQTAAQIASGEITAEHLIKR